MWLKDRKINILIKSINKLINMVEKSNYMEFAYLLRKQKRNILAGIARGVGVGIGVTIITAILLILLRRIVTLNIPILGEYISDIVEIVEKNR